MDLSSQDTGGSKPDPYAGWQGMQAHPNAPSGGGGSGRFRSAGPLGTTAGTWHGIPHPLAPGARYLAANDAYSGFGTSSNVIVEERNSVFYITLSAWAAMRPIMRTMMEPFESTVRRHAARNHFAVLVNGNMYRDSSKFGNTRNVKGSLGLHLSPQDATLTTPEGVARGRGTVLGGVAESHMYWVAYVDGPLGGYSFGHGNPPTDATSSIGGLGPVIVDGLKYGSVNRYRRDVPADAAPVGEPEARHKPFLVVRSNNMYKSFADRGPGTGKVVIGLGSKNSATVRIAVQPDKVVSTSLDEIRDHLYEEGVRNAVFMDGSDSAMLFANGKFYVQQGVYKDRSNTVGVGFQLPFSYLDAPGRSVGHIA